MTPTYPAYDLDIVSPYELTDEHGNPLDWPDHTPGLVGIARATTTINGRTARVLQAVTTTHPDEIRNRYGTGILEAFSGLLNPQGGLARTRT